MFMHVFKARPSYSHEKFNCSSLILRKSAAAPLSVTNRPTVSIITLITVIIINLLITRFIGYKNVQIE